MKKKAALVLYCVFSVLVLMLLLARENIFVVGAIILGLVLLGHREIWSLIRYRRFPVIDERVRDNLTGAMRITGIFFFIATIVLVLLMRFNVFTDTPKELIISGQLVIVGLVYLLGYYYHDRVRPNLGDRAGQWLKICLITAGISLSTIALSITLHNMISMWFDFEEAVFFILGLLVAPAVLAFSLTGLLVIYVKGLFGSTGRGETL